MIPPPLLLPKGLLGDLGGRGVASSHPPRPLLLSHPVPVAAHATMGGQVASIGASGGSVHVVGFGVAVGGQGDLGGPPTDGGAHRPGGVQRGVGHRAGRDHAAASGGAQVPGEGVRGFLGGSFLLVPPPQRCTAHVQHDCQYDEYDGAAHGCADDDPQANRVAASEGLQQHGVLARGADHGFGAPNASHVSHSSLHLLQPQIRHQALPIIHKSSELGLKLPRELLFRHTSLHSKVRLTGRLPNGSRVHHQPQARQLLLNFLRG